MLAFLARGSTVRFQNSAEGWIVRPVQKAYGMGHPSLFCGVPPKISSNRLSASASENSFHARRKHSRVQNFPCRKSLDLTTRNGLPLAQILDNLLAKGKAVPMIVVMPDGHALPPETTPVTSPDFIKIITPYLPKNQRAADAELFHDIILFIEAHYTGYHLDPNRRGQKRPGTWAIERG
jgi:hypothetical protein